MKLSRILPSLMAGAALLAASSAAASSPPHLSIQEKGTPLEAGAPVAPVLEIEEGKFTFGLCVIEESGALEHNERPNDRTSVLTAVHTACADESVTGAVSHLDINWNGEVRWIQQPKERLRVTVGKCVYQFGRITTDEAFPGPLESHANVEGYLSRNESNISCSQIENFIFYARFSGLEGELRG
jgi:hypothetical protein